MLYFRTLDGAFVSVPGAFLRKVDLKIALSDEALVSNELFAVKDPDFYYARQVFKALIQPGDELWVVVTKGRQRGYLLVRPYDVDMAWNHFASSGILIQSLMHPIYHTAGGIAGDEVRQLTRREFIDEVVRPQFFANIGKCAHQVSVRDTREIEPWRSLIGKHRNMPTWKFSEPSKLLHVAQSKVQTEDGGWAFLYHSRHWDEDEDRNLVGLGDFFMLIDSPAPVFDLNEVKNVYIWETGIQELPAEYREMGPLLKRHWTARINNMSVPAQHRYREASTVFEQVAR